MNKVDLKIRLESVGIDPRAYSLDGGLPNEGYVFNEEGNGRWEVYYSERGQKTSVRKFDSETEAADYFLIMILNDRAVRQMSNSDNST